VSPCHCRQAYGRIGDAPDLPDLDLPEKPIRQDTHHARPGFQDGAPFLGTRQGLGLGPVSRRERDFALLRHARRDQAALGTGETAFLRQALAIRRRDAASHVGQRRMVAPPAHRNGAW
jgi:hypothetical protein